MVPTKSCGNYCRNLTTCVIFGQGDSSGEHQMVLGEYERQALLFNLHVEIVPDEASDHAELTAAEAVSILHDIYRSGDAKMRIAEYVGEPDESGGEAEEDTLGQNVILIRDMSIDKNGMATILLQHGDAQAADPALMKLRTGVVRTAGKTDDEVVAYAGHLIISTGSHISKTGQCRALLERVPNLGRSTVIAFLNRLLRKHASEKDFRYKDPDTKNEKKYHPKLVSLQQLSHRLKSDLQDGKLNRIEFITRKSVAGFEEKNRVEPVTQIIVHKVVNAPTGKPAIDLLNRAQDWARQHNYEEMQIRFRDVVDRRSASPRFATDLNDAADAVYARMEPLKKFRNALAQCPERIVNSVRTKMVNMFDVEALWR
jgi:hypothetical protein